MSRRQPALLRRCELRISLRYARRVLTNPIDEGAKRTAGPSRAEQRMNRVRSDAETGRVSLHDAQNRRSTHANAAIYRAIQPFWVAQMPHRGMAAT